MQHGSEVRPTTTRLYLHILARADCCDCKSRQVAAVVLHELQQLTTVLLQAFVSDAICQMLKLHDAVLLASCCSGRRSY